MVSAPGPSPVPRVAFVAGRGVGTAVDRNRAKRRLREALAQVPIGQDRDYVVIAARAVIEGPFEDLVAWLRETTEDER